MRGIRILSVILFVFCSAALSQSITGRVMKIKDGDSFLMLVGADTVEIRLAGIDCPELRQPYSKIAKNFTSDACLMKEVTAVGTEKDKYGRLLAEIFLPDGNSLNRQLLINGLAWHFKKYDTNAELAQLENDAQTGKIGLWRESAPVAPWDYRNMNRQKKSKATSIHAIEN